MKRFELSIEVAPIDAPTIEALKAAGHAVYKGRTSWRVVVTRDVLSQGSVRAQAHVVMRDVVEQFGLAALQDPPAFGLRDPDDEESASANLMLEGVRRAYEPDPLTRSPRRWYQRWSEMGLGERKGD